MVVVAPGWACRPATQRDSRFLRNVGECSIVIIMVEPVLAKIGHVDIRPAVVVVVRHSHTESPALVGDPRYSGDICECAVVVIMQEHRPWSGFLTFQGADRGTVQEVDVQPAVVVIVEQSDARAHGLEDGFLRGRARTMLEFIQSRQLGDIGKYHWSAIDEATGRNGPGKCIFNGRMRGTRSYPHPTLRLPVWRLGCLLTGCQSGKNEDHGNSEKNRDSPIFWVTNSQALTSHTRKTIASFSTPLLGPSVTAGPSQKPWFSAMSKNHLCALTNACRIRLRKISLPSCADFFVCLAYDGSRQTVQA